MSRAARDAILAGLRSGATLHALGDVPDVPAPAPASDPVVAFTAAVERAASVLGWSAKVSLEQGLRETVAYFTGRRPT